MDAAIQRAIEQRELYPDDTKLWEQTTKEVKKECLPDAPVSAQPDQVNSARERSWQREYFNSSFPGPTFGI
jgi:hypothetical protein